MHRLDRLRVAALAGAVLLLATPVPAGEITGKLITRAERQIIEHYFDSGSRSQAKSQGGRKGNAQNKGKGKKNLPKGIAMKLARGGTLPPGIAKRNLPSSLNRQLPERPRGQEYKVVDDNVVLIEAATGVILDILEHVIRD